MVRVIYYKGFRILEYALSLLECDPVLRQYCADNNVPLYGSYDPACIEGLQETDFFDGLHCGGTGIERFFPGIPQALADLQNGTLANPLDVHPRTSLDDPNAEPVDPDTNQQEG